MARLTFIHNLEIKFQSFQISNFSGRGGMQTLLKPLSRGKNGVKNYIIDWLVVGGRHCPLLD